ncbi:hypothetical protein MBLNU459_g1434t1 [Dothideomycetes sp. NU459]
MPTPSDDTLLQLSPPTDISDSRSVHTTCPPEDVRDYHAPREDRVREDVRTHVDARAESASAAPMPIPDERSAPVAVESSAAESNTTSLDAPSKGMDAVEEALARDSPAPFSPFEESKDSDARLAHSMSAAAISTSFPSAHLGYSGAAKRQPHPCSTSSFLRPGSRFHGTQQSDRQTYEVQVEIKDVDMEESFLCGYLRIQGLTDDHPTLTTYFEGEIIGTKHSFKTAHPEWGSTEKVDMQHWARFPAWRPLAKQAKSTNFTLKNFVQREHLFMRWKEYFLVPDHKVKSITGASFEGFYYICFNQCSGTVSGIYFHSRSEK